MWCLDHNEARILEEGKQLCQKTICRFKLVNMKLKGLIQMLFLGDPLSRQLAKARSVCSHEHLSRTDKTVF